VTPIITGDWGDWEIEPMLKDRDRYRLDRSDKISGRELTIDLKLANRSNPPLKFNIYL
jgi:hypothetical protein